MLNKRWTNIKIMFAIVIDKMDFHQLPIIVNLFDNRVEITTSRLIHERG